MGPAGEGGNFFLVIGPPILAAHANHTLRRAALNSLLSAFFFLINTRPVLAGACPYSLRVDPFQRTACSGEAEGESH